MKYWEGVHYLLWNDIRNARWKNLVLLVFITYISIFTSDGMVEIIATNSYEDQFLMDYLIIMVLSVVGLVTTHLYGYGWKKDLLAERLAYWRSLPIKIDQIVWSRLTGVTLFSFLAVVAYYALTGWIMIASRGVSIELGPYIMHGLTVFAIIYVFNLFYLYMEMCFSYKKYTVYCWTIPFIKLAVVIAYVFIFDFYLLKGIYDAVQKSPVLMIAASIILIIASFFLAFRIINERVRTRNITA
ncbi:hypothetical protein [Paenibacillus camelliae]|uniref:hypothetical protein n=1 Tax=Paenibacillus camelliae TaxID=512410 RepID=UPI00203E441E|nr:hypothetical protein [Paenibacillus camelliae]MCM3634651.1 hypothetical protein [Paenibacillus camelliae]